MRRSHAHTERGFTLAEIMVTTAIFAIIMIAALTVYDRSNKVFKSGTEAADLQQSTRIAFDKLTSDIRIAGFDYNRGGTPNGAIGATLWSPSTSYAAGVQVDPGNGMIYTCSTAGTSGASAPTWNLNVNGITSDGTAKWTTVVVNQFAQMDEQLEYAGKSAIVFRANFDYNTDPAHGNGLEDAEGYTPVDPATGTKIFPYVTTGNDEIVAYALRSADSSKNTGSISFYMDAAKPRASYPGGSAEAKVTIGQGQGITGQSVTATSCSGCGIDLTNNNPPYTLYRITVDDVMKGSMGTPVAENVRSMNFYYYTDANASTFLKNTDGTDIALTRDAAAATTDAHDQNNAVTGAVGGDGQYNPANSATSNYADRSLRAAIQSIRVQMVGMNATPDGSYTNPTETLAALKNYREYSLQAVIVPRNFGLTGFPEPTNDRPGPPTITGACTGYCAAPVIAWQAPQTGSAVLKYILAWDTNPQGCFCQSGQSLTIVDPTQTKVIVNDNGSLDPSVVWYFQIAAVNDNGQSAWSNQYQVTPKNSTKPAAPTGFSATTATQSHSANAANTDYAVTLNWISPATNDPSKAITTCTGTGCTADGTIIPSQEGVKFRVWRGTTAAFDPNNGEGVQILGYSSTSQPAGVSPGSAATWLDSPATSAYPPGTCVQYFYRVQALDRCSTSAAYNASNNANDGMSAWAPAAPTSAITGQAYDAGVQATAPSGLAVDIANSSCPAGQNCTIILNWTKVTTDTAGNTIGVDRYQVTRNRKKAASPSFTLDTTFGTAGKLLQSGYSQAAGTAVTFKDTTAPAIDSSDGLRWYYQYTVAADDCRVGQSSAPVVYPVGCTFSATFGLGAGATGTGTSADPFILDSGDTIKLTGGTGMTSVTYDVYLNGVLKTSSGAISVSPYVYTWPSGLASGTTYTVNATVKSASCTEVYVLYVVVDTPNPCAFANVAEGAITETGGSQSNPFTVSETYTITNSGTENMTLGGMPITITWQYPADGQHNDMSLDSVDWGCAADNTGGLSPGALTRTIKSCVGAAGILAPGASQAFKLVWTFRKQDPALVPPANASAGLQKVCIAYTIPSENATKKCNLVGQAGATQNPTNCD